MDKNILTHIGNNWASIKDTLATIKKCETIIQQIEEFLELNDKWVPTSVKEICVRRLDMKYEYREWMNWKTHLEIYQDSKQALIVRRIYLLKKMRKGG